MNDEPEKPLDSSAKKTAPKPLPSEPPTALAQTLINLQAWAPFLQNPTQRASLVRYTAREKRDTGTWRINLPVVCWKCQATEGLKTRKISRMVRSFDMPIPIGVAGVTFTAIQGLLALLMLIWGRPSWAGIFAFTGSLTLLVSSGLLFLKSWTEEVKLSLQTCPKCEFEFREPNMATDQEDLHLFLPTPELAAAALADQKAERRSKKSGASEAPAESGEEARPKKKKLKSGEGGPAPAGPAAPPRQHGTPDLPPISLDDAPATTPKVLKPGLGKPPASAPRTPPHDDLPPIKLDD